MRSLAGSGGAFTVHLLIFVIKCGRLTVNTQKDYELFFRSFCESQVPVLVVVTGCENIEAMYSSQLVE